MRDVKLLVVDDEQEFAEALAERLSFHNMSPQVITSGSGAVAALKDGIPDVMILDMMMPDINGMEVLKRVKAFYPQVEVIVLTGYGSEESLEEAKSLGAFDYMTKPVDFEKLVASIHRSVELP
ncbi:MAG: response regulator [Desulfovibrionales bacterium]|nr:response regulator [Desulfovibrionales bacterium]